MKLNLKNNLTLDLEDSLTVVDNYPNATFYFFTSGGMVRVDKNNRKAMVVYNSGDVLFLSPDGNQYKIDRVWSHDGIVSK